MFATLVVVLPSTHTGGELVVRHKGLCQHSCQQVRPVHSDVRRRRSGCLQDGQHGHGPAEKGQSAAEGGDSRAAFKTAGLFLSQSGWSAEMELVSFCWRRPSLRDSCSSWLEATAALPLPRAGSRIAASVQMAVALDSSASRSAAVRIG